MNQVTQTPVRPASSRLMTDWPPTTATWETHAQKSIAKNRPIKTSGAESAAHITSAHGISTTMPGLIRSTSDVARPDTRRGPGPHQRHRSLASSDGARVDGPRCEPAVHAFRRPAPDRTPG